MSGKINSLIQYYFNSDTIYRLHSPGLYDLVTKVFENKDYYYDFDLLAEVYNQLIRSDELIESTEFAMQRLQSGQKIGSFAQKALHPVEELHKLYKLIKWFCPSTILEFGTCLGLSSLTMQCGAPNAKVYTVEGNSQFVQIARQIHTHVGYPQIQTIQANFEEAISNFRDKSLDCVFIDGDHTYTATHQLINKINPLLGKKSLIILDDIHWSSDMYKAWVEIRHSDFVHCSLETLRWGLLFTDPNLSPIHFNLIPSSFKIWQKFI